MTAELSVWALQAVGVEALRLGSSMQVNGQFIVVDAPCSGVQMVWMAYFSACVMALALSLPARVFLRRLPLVGALVLAGNVLRNLVLVVGESQSPLAQGVHDGVGLAVLAAVCAGVCLLMRKAAR